MQQSFRPKSAGFALDVEEREQNMKMETRTWLVFFVSAFLVRLAHGQSPSPSARDVLSEVIEQAAKETSKNEKSAGGTTKLEPWQTSPDEFARELQRLFSKRAGETEIARCFNGKEVHWPGILARVEKKASDAGVIAGVWITDVPLVAPDGTPAYVGLLALDFANFVMPADKHIRFRATISNVSTMQVINEKDHSKETAIMVETEGDTPVIEDQAKPKQITAQENFWCNALLKSSVDEKDLPQGYSHPQITSLEMTPDETASGMLCKISIVLQGPDKFDAIRFRFYRDFAAAERGLKTLAQMVPGLTVINEKLFYGSDTPCMSYTTGSQPLTFVTCAQVADAYSVVISGVSSQARNGNSVTTDTISKAGRLFDAGKKHWVTIMADNIEQIAKEFDEEGKN
jgi:hypothetical protein